MRLDTHLHLWDPALGVYDWLTPELGPLHATFTAEQAHRELAASSVNHAVLVQAADASEDTAALLDVAQSRDWVAGVVGWIDLEDPDRAGESLDALTEAGPLVGVRQLVHDDARPDVLGLPSVRSTARALADRHLTLDVPDAFPRQLEGAIALAEAVDDLVVVVDHLAKPPRGSATFGDWADQVRRAGRLENVVAKVSGLELSGQPWTTEALRPTWEVALDAFGPTRLMFGSDWPMTVGGHGYAGTVAVLEGLISSLSAEDQQNLWWRTGDRVYGLSTAGP